MNHRSTVILGIDPGSKKVGYGLIKKTGGDLKLVDANLLNHPKNLLEIKRQISFLIDKFKPQALAIEKLYFSKNQKTAFAVAEARGVIILAALEKNLAIWEFTPNEVKSAITGYGLADKKAVAKMVRLTLNEPDLKVIDDVSDALAIAITATSRLLKPSN